MKKERGRGKLFADEGEGGVGIPWYLCWGICPPTSKGGKGNITSEKWGRRKVNKSGFSAF